MVCSKCGTNNVDTAAFCASCGSQLGVVPAPIQNNPVVNNVVTPVNLMQPATKKEVDIKRFVIVGLLLAIIMMMIVFIFVMKKDDDNSSGGGNSQDDGLTSRTVMIYLVGSNLETDSAIVTADLNGIVASDVDLENVNVLLYTGGTEEWHNFISNDENAIYELTSEGFIKKQTYNKDDMGDSKTLTTLLNYGYENYKTDEYDLIFYNHGGAIDGAIYDDFTNDHLTIAEMGDAFEASPFKGENKLEVILFRTCLNGTLEVASELDNYADYMVASEEVTIGGNRSSVLSFLNNIEETDSAIDYGKKFITEYEKQVNEIDPLGMGNVPMYAVIDLSNIDSVISELDKFVNGIDVTKDYSNIIKVRGSLYQYAYSFFGDGSYDMVDLYTLVDRIDDYSNVNSDKLKNAINSAVVYNWSNVSEESHGLSVYFPYNGSTIIQNKFLSYYNELDFSDSYVTFIKKISSLVKSNKTSNFSSNSIVDSKSEVTKGEFSLELTDKQVADFADAMYIVFRKEDDGLFTPIYSSDNAYLDGNKVKTRITNNLIKIKDHRDNSSEFIQLVERSKGGVKSLTTGAVAYYFGVNNDLSDWEIASLDFTIDYKDGKPYIASTALVDRSSDAISVRYVDINHYDSVEFTSFRYGILDKDGKYKEDWDSNDVKYLFGIKPSEGYELVNVSLDDEGDYYTIFSIRDIYGNVFYSNLVSVNK